MTDVSVVSGRHVGAHTNGHQHGVSIQISVNLGKKFLRISRIRKISVTRILARVFAYLLSLPALDCLQGIMLIRFALGWLNYRLTCIRSEYIT